MERKIVDINQFTVSPHDFWDRQWLLLTCGDFKTGHFNTMTVSWGSFGTMWNMPVAMIVVRPPRYTFEFIEKYETFTLCSFTAEYRPALQMMGTLSGRDCDKVARAQLTPAAGLRAAAPVYAEARYALECRKIYWDDFKPEHFLEPSLNHYYAEGDYHRMYLGEILQVTEAA